MDLQIDAKTQAIIHAIVAVMAVVAAMSPSMFPGYLPSTWVAYTVQTCGFVVAVYSAVTGVMVSYSSAKPGPLVK
jgi:hypothetical protein